MLVTFSFCGIFFKVRLKCIFKPSCPPLFRQLAPYRTFLYVAYQRGSLLRTVQIQHAEKHLLIDSMCLCIAMIHLRIYHYTKKGALTDALYVVVQSLILTAYTISHFLTIIHYHLLSSFANSISKAFNALL